MQDCVPFKGTVQETMLGPLWARATYSKLYPKLLNDQKAIDIIEKIEYDFSELKDYLVEWRALGLLARARNFDEIVRKFIERNPNATIVNIGAGLDTTFYRVNNGKVIWYELDLPDAIEFRKKFLSETLRSKFLPKSAFDYSWFDDIDYDPEKGIFFIAGGFTIYFTEAEVSSFIHALANRFPEGEMVFDCISKLALRITTRRAKKAGTKRPYWQLSISDPDKQIPKWSEKIKVLDWFSIWARINIDPSWSIKTRKMIKLSNRFKTGKIVHLKFIK